MSIYHILSIIQIPIAFLVLASAITSKGQTRVWRVGLLLFGLTIALNAFNEFYAVYMNTRVLFIMKAIHAVLTIVVAIVIVFEYPNRLQKSG